MQHAALHNPLDRATPAQLAELDRLHMMTRTERVLDHLDELAIDVGRLRRRLAPETSLAWTGERIAAHVETLINSLEPTAAQIAAQTAPGDETAITEAIRLVDARHTRLRRQLGWPA